MISPVTSAAVTGMQAAVRPLAASAMHGANPKRALDHVEREVVQQQVSLRTYQANATVLRTADELLGTLFDTQG